MKNKRKSQQVAVLKLRMMTDEEWNRLAYKNWIERKEDKKNGK